MRPGSPEFAVPTSGENPQEWHDSPVTAWAAPLAAVPGGTPDPMRTRILRVRDYRPEPGEPPEDFWLGVNGPGRDEIRRHGVEYQDADGFAYPAPGARRMAPNPRATPPPEPRLTNRMSPLTYVFTRPFDQHAARRLNGTHFSMADHRRDYPIMGMRPAGSRRNTFRADPVPWDSDLVDLPGTGVEYARPGPLIAVEVPPTRNWRL